MLGESISLNFAPRCLCLLTFETGTGKGPEQKGQPLVHKALSEKEVLTAARLTLFTVIFEVCVGSVILNKSFGVL